MMYTLLALAVVAAVEASPFPQGVTAAVSPSAPAPPGCSPNYSGTFGIAVMNATGTAAVPVTQSMDGQPGASTGGAVVSAISDGQPQAPTSVAPISQISDGQIQAVTKTMGPINQIGDGQIQNQVPKATPVQQISDGQVQNPKPTATPVNQISDGQIQQPTPNVTPVNQISDGQIQKPTPNATPVNQISDGQIQKPTPNATPVNQISDGQVQKPTSVVGTMADGQPTAAAGGSGSGGTMYVACKASDSLEITLNNGILKDNQGRTGYIASNYQFQFDGPPQAGAIYTAGFSVCNNGSLALGGSNIFYQCLSGNFYNLYDRNWAPQCSPINIQVVNLVDC